MSHYDNEREKHIMCERKKTIIAIDPDLRKSGVCIMRDGEIERLSSIPFVELVALIQNNKDAIFAIEDVNKIKAMYARGGKTNNTTIAQNVGMCKAVGTLIIELCEYNSMRPVILAPVGLGKQVKKNAALFKKLSGYQERTNEDMRDAWAIAKWATGQTR